MVDDTHEMHRTLGRIEGALKAVATGLEDVKKDQSELRENDEKYRTKADTRHIETSEKINNIKSRQNYRDGGLAVLMFVVIFFKEKINLLLG